MWGECSLPGQAVSEPSDLIASHIEWLRRRGLSEGTIKNRRIVLRRLARALPCLPVGATRAHLEAWADARPREGKGLSDGSWRNELIQVREFYRWLIRQEIRSDDPTGRIPMPRLSRTSPRPLSDKVTGPVLTGALPDDAAIIALARFAGLRACEVARLAWTDVDLDDRLLFVRRGKGGHQREVPIGTSLLPFLVALPHRHGPVVRRLDGRSGHCTDNTVSRRGSDLLPDGATMHQLRHAFGTTTYQNSMDLRVVQDLLGHSSPSTTAIYAKTRTGAARQAVDGAGLNS